MKGFGSDELGGSGAPLPNVSDPRDRLKETIKALETGDYAGIPPRPQQLQLQKQQPNISADQVRVAELLAFVYLCEPKGWQVMMFQTGGI